MLEKGRSVLYVQLQKALNGMMKSALLFYKKLVGELQSMGFEINPYKPCVANKMVNGSQMTIRWHVDFLDDKPPESRGDHAGGSAEKRY